LITPFDQRVSQGLTAEAVVHPWWILWSDVSCKKAKWLTGSTTGNMAQNDPEYSFCL